MTGEAPIVRRPLKWGRPTTLGMLGCLGRFDHQAGYFVRSYSVGEHSGCAHVCGVCMCAIVSVLKK